MSWSVMGVGGGGGWVVVFMVQVTVRAYIINFFIVFTISSDSLQPN